MGRVFTLSFVCLQGGPTGSHRFLPFRTALWASCEETLDVLQEWWKEEKSSKLLVAAHVVKMCDWLEEMMEVVQGNVAQAQARQKQYYDQGMKDRILKTGDQVLALLPAAMNKLKLEWVGPYKVLRQVTPVDSEVSTPGRRQEKIYHINLLKLWRPPQEESNLLASVLSSVQERNWKLMTCIPGILTCYQLSWMTAQL